MSSAFVPYCNQPKAELVLFVAAGPNMPTTPILGCISRKGNVRSRSPVPFPRRGAADRAPAAATEVSGTRPQDRMRRARGRGSGAPTRATAAHREGGEGLRGSEASPDAARSEDKRGWSTCRARARKRSEACPRPQRAIAGATAERPFPLPHFPACSGESGGRVERRIRGKRSEAETRRRPGSPPPALVKSAQPAERTWREQPGRRVRSGLRRVGAQCSGPDPKRNGADGFGAVRAQGRG